MHLLEPDTSRLPLLQYDAHIAGTGILPPSTIVLDFIYGVAAYRCWGSGHDIKEVMEDHVTKHYKSIPIPPASLPSSDGDSSPESHNDDNDNKSYKLRRPTRRNRTSTMSDGMLRAMDDILMLSMLLKGRTPELMATERQRQEEEDELRVKEASQVKVQQWLQSSPVCSLLPLG